MSQAEIGERTWIDERADRFESDWKRGGDRPRIEDFLDRRDRPLARRPAPGAAAGRARAAARRRRAARRRGVSPALPGRPRRRRRRLRSEDRPKQVPREPPATTAQGLLFGLLALQNNFIDRDALLAAFNAWVADKSQSLGQILLDRGALSPARHAADRDPGPGAPPAARLRPRAQPGRAHGRPRRSATTSRSCPTSTSRPASSISACPRTDEDGRSGESTASWDDEARPADAEGRFRIVRLPRPRRPGRGLRRPRPATAPDRGPQADQDAITPPTGTSAPGSSSRPRSPAGWSTPASCRSTAWGPTTTAGRSTPCGSSAATTSRRPSSSSTRPTSQRPRPRRADPGASQAAAAVPRRLQRDRLRPQPRRAPPRPEAGQHHARQVRRDAGGRLGPGQERGPARGAPASATLDDRTLVPQSGSDLRGTEVGARLGTPAYMSPEQAAGRIDRPGPGQRRLQPGRHALLPADRPGPVQRRRTWRSCSARSSGAISRRRASSRAGSTPRWRRSASRRWRPTRPGATRTPRALADDVEHWLADEPVSAWREPLTSGRGGGCGVTGRS